MKGNILTVLGVGLPLVIMLVIWRHERVMPNAAQMPARSRSTPAASGLNSRLGKAASAPQPIEAAREQPARQPAPQLPSLVDALDDYLARWEAEARRNPAYQCNAAALLLQQGRYDAAVQAFDRLLVRQPDDPLLLTGKAVALTGLGRNEDALPLFETVARQDPKNATAQFNYAVSLMRSAERAAAIPVFQRVLQLDPRHGKALFNLAVLLESLGRSSDALDTWRRLTASAEAASRPAPVAGANPANPDTSPPPAAPPATLAGLSPAILADAWSHRGELALHLKQPVEAEMCFLRVARLEPRSALAWCNVGIARADQVRRDDAILAFNTALELDPDLVPALNQIAYIQAANYRDTGNPTYAEAVADCCRRSLLVKPDQPNIIALRQAVRRAKAAGLTDEPAR